jgi:hypothetical protein
MIPLIALMIGIYVVIGLLNLATTASAHFVVRLLAVLGILAELLLTVMVLAAGSSVPLGLPH